ncbi:MAG: RHS repeat-associated core domain-containing protein, partial [Chloroflexota bacterium]
QGRLYVGSYYEVQGATTRKYYYLGAQRVAMLENSTVYYLLGDHLGSTALTVNSVGAKYGELRYKAFGETRYTFGTTPTTFAFTGQRQESGLGLYFYNARWYDPALGRFIQADTIVPNPVSPQSLNRYSYALNNPTRYTDPSGHCITDPLSFAVCTIVFGAMVLALTSDTMAPELRAEAAPVAAPSENEFKGFVFILVCGAGTNCPEPGGSDYNGKTPFEPLADAVVAGGGEVVYVPGAWQSQNDLQDMVKGINNAIESHPDAKGYFLAGHSLGANAVVSALHQAPYNPKIKGVALLDPDLADPGVDPGQKRHDSQTAGADVSNLYPTFLLQATSPENSFPFGGRPASYQTSHTRLTIHGQATNDMLQFFRGHSRME